MSRYHYKQATLIESVDISSPRAGIVQATLTSVDNADESKIEELRRKLGARGFSTLIDQAEGR